MIGRAVLFEFGCQGRDLREDNDTKQKQTRVPRRPKPAVRAIDASIQPSFIIHQSHPGNLNMPPFQL